MRTDDEFTPRIGRMRARGSNKPRRLVGRVLAAANLARGGAPLGAARSGFTGARVGRGSGAGRLLAARGSQARRVMLKARIVQLRGRGLSGATAHLRYLQRDGVTPDGERGALYGREEGAVMDGRAFLESAAEDRHQFRFIVSPEDGAEYTDLKPLTRRLMATMEEDLATLLDWVAVDHHNTGHPHTHIILRGRDGDGKDLVIAREYLTRGIRERAVELVSLDLGPRTQRDVERQLRREVDQHRLTSIDRALLRDADGAGQVTGIGRDPLDHALRTGRLQTLARLGLATLVGQGRWTLEDGLAETLTRMGERADIIRTMQRAMGDIGQARAAADQTIYDPTAPGARSLVGRVLARGLADEMADRHYLLVDGIDGRLHYVDIGKGAELGVLGPQAIVRIEPSAGGIREVDRTIVAVAAANGGRYDVDRHLRHDPGATDRFAETHVRRLEAMRRRMHSVEREPSGSWVIDSDHLERVSIYEAALKKDRPVLVSQLGVGRLEPLVSVDAASWIDRDLASGNPMPLRDTGFGREMADVQRRRQLWLAEEGLAEGQGATFAFRTGAIANLQRREFLRISAQLSDELGRGFAEAETGTWIEGRLTRRVDLHGGRFALVERAHDFSLVPWRDVLDRHVGKTVSGLVREGGVNWSLGRERSGLGL